MIKHRWLHETNIFSDAKLRPAVLCKSSVFDIKHRGLHETNIFWTQNSDRPSWVSQVSLASKTDLTNIHNWFCQSVYPYYFRSLPPLFLCLPILQLINFHYKLLFQISSLFFTKLLELFNFVNLLFSFTLELSFLFYFP